MNVWMALRGAPNALIQTRLRHNFDEQNGGGPYNGPVAERHANLFTSFHDWENVQGLFKAKGGGSAGYTLWSVHVALGFDEDGNPDTSVIDDLQATYPGNQVLVLGAWDNNGVPFGCDPVYEEIVHPPEPVFYPPNGQQVDADGNPVWEDGDPILDENGDPVLDENGDPIYEQVPVLWGPGVPVIDPETGEQAMTPEWTETVITGATGTPIYADDSNILDFTPDDVVYDVDGNEVSRTDATAPKQVNVLAGQRPRFFKKSDGSDW